MSHARQLARLPLWQPLRSHDFRLLFIGESVSMAGSQFGAVAFAWLGYRTTGSALALASIFIAGGLPRLVLMLLGGAVTDRVTPWRVMVFANAAFALTSASLSLLAFLDAARLPHLFIASLIFGAGSAFFLPSLFAMLPRTLERDRLRAGNALMETANSLTAFLGPGLAGLTIAVASGPRGAGLAFAVDAASFLFALLTLLRISRSARAPLMPTPTGGYRARIGAAGLLLSIRQGLTAAWADTGLRTFLLLLTVNNLAFYGPFRVGLAALSAHHFSGGAAALGSLYGAWGGGALIGAVIAGIMPPVRRYGLLMVAGAAVQGAASVLIGVAPVLPLAIALILAIGVEGGAGNVLFGAWLQTRTDPDMLGRVMSLVGIANVGLMPLSFALTGALLDVDPTLTFALAGGLVLAVGAGALLSPTVRDMA